jgi:orotidine-5'-phosphate decarboxylase
MYDHQKGGTDVPHTGALFANVMAEAGIDYAILFPFAAPSTGKAWIGALLKEGVIPVVGALMTIPDFLKDGGGYIDADAVGRIFDLASSLGVTDFVLPGNKPDAAMAFRQRIEAKVQDPNYFLPGLGAQGGDIASCSKAMGKRWHPIVGRSVYEAKDPSSAVASLAAQLG